MSETIETRLKTMMVERLYMSVAPEKIDDTKSLIDEYGVELRRLPDDVLRALWQGTREAMDKLVASDPMAAKVYQSYREFYKGVRNYHHISEQAYINMRDQVLGEGEY